LALTDGIAVAADGVPFLHEARRVGHEQPSLDALNVATSEVIVNPNIEFVGLPEGDQRT
jgi:hypothetical protein